MKISAKQYAISLYESIAGKSGNDVKAVMKKFVEILYKNNQVSKIEKIIEQFMDVWNKENGIVEAEVTSAKEMDKEIVKLINGYVAKLSGAKEVVLGSKVDKNILGGVVIKYGDKVIDGSLKTRLGELKAKLIK